MSGRDHGDGEGAPEDASLASAAAAEAATATRARAQTRQGRRRSLRVPVDDVPRRSTPSAELPVIRDSDPDGLPPLGAEATQVAVMTPELAAEAADAAGRTAGARTSDAPSIEVGLEIPEVELRDDELAEDAPELSEDDEVPALEDEPTRVAHTRPSAPPPAQAPSTTSTSPRPATVPPPGVPGGTAPAGAVAPPSAAAASSPPQRPATVPPPRPATVPPPARPATVPPARPVTVPPPAMVGGVSSTEIELDDDLGAPMDGAFAGGGQADASAPASASTAPADAGAIETSAGAERDDEREAETVDRPAAAREPAGYGPSARQALANDAFDTGPAGRDTSPGERGADADEAVTVPGTTSAPVERSRLSRPPQPAVVVARMVRVSAPPPAPAPSPAPSPASARADEPELSIGDVDAFEELEVDVGEDDREESAEARPRDSAPDLTDEATEDADAEGDAEIEMSAGEIELPDEEEIVAGAALRPPPPPREAARSEPRIEIPREARAATPPEAEEELDDLEPVESSGEIDTSTVDGDKGARSAPPPAPAKPAKPAPAAAAPAAAAAAEPAAEPPRRAKKKGNWWEDFFNDDYLRTVPPPNPRQIARQCDFIEARLALKEGGTILDVGCGLGLHAIELTRRGYLVVGLDLSLPMLSRAADEAQDQGFRINFLHADMREMNFEGAFDAVMCIGTTYGYFDDDANRALVERLYRALKPKGKLLLEVVNRDFVVRSQPNLVWFEGDGCVVMEETQANYITSRLQVKRTVILDDGRQRDNAYSVRLYALHELGQVLHQRGFRVVEVSGREATPGVFFGADSPKLIILAERRVQQAPPPPKKSGPSSEGAPTGEIATPDPSTATAGSSGDES